MYLPYADGMRVLAVAAVALLHASATGVVRHDSLGSLQWWTANAIDASCRWAVPVFLMLSGALALDPARHEPLLLYYRRRLMRVGIPLVAWAAFYFLWAATYHDQRVTAESIGASLRAGLVENHLYFLVVILGLYAVAPVLREVVRRVEPSAGWMLAVLLCGLAACGIPQGYSPMNAFTLITPYVGYFVLGFLLRGSALARRGRGSRQPRSPSPGQSSPSARACALPGGDHPTIARSPSMITSAPQSSFSPSAPSC